MINFIKDYFMAIVWIIFVLCVYIYAYIDYIYFKNNWKEKIENFYKVLTEEE